MWNLICNNDMYDSYFIFIIELSGISGNSIDFQINSSKPVGQETVSASCQIKHTIPLCYLRALVRLTDWNFHRFDHNSIMQELEWSDIRLIDVKDQ